jgi:uncharacterized protein YjiS (DUF1127 family)
MAFISDTANSISAPKGAGVFAQLKARVARYRVYRTTLNELSALSNRELADLAMHRAQIRGIAWSVAYENALTGK